MGGPRGRDPRPAAAAGPPVHPGVLRPVARAGAGTTSTRSTVRWTRSSRPGPSRSCASASSRACSSPRSTRTSSSRTTTASGRSWSISLVRHYQRARRGDPLLGGRQRAGHRRERRLPLPLPAGQLRALLPAHGRGDPAGRPGCPRGRAGAGRRGLADPAGAAGVLREGEGRRCTSSPGTSTAATRSRSAARSTGSRACWPSIRRSSPRRSWTNGTWRWARRRATRAFSRASWPRSPGR